MKEIKVAITGASGFIGRYLVSKLRKNKDLQLILFDRDRANLLDYKSLKSFVVDANIVIHLAGVNRESDINLLQINTLGTQSLLEAIRCYSPASRLIYISTFQVYNPNNIYGLSKFFAEKLVEYYCKKEYLKSTILRLSNVYGPGCRPFYNSVIATFINQIKNEQPLSVTGDGEQKRDYVYISDVVKAIEKTISYTQEKPIERFNIASGALVSLNSLINILKKCYLGEIIINFQTNQDPNNNISSTKDVSSAYKKLKWVPLVDIEKGLKLTFENIDL